MGLPYSPFVQIVSVEGTKRTYSGASQVIAANIAALATDIAQVIGAAGIAVRITRVELSADATAASNIIFKLTKRTTPNTGGTFADNPAMPHDSFDPPHSATRRLYSANPTVLGTGQDFRIIGYSLPATLSTPGLPFAPETFTFGHLNTKSIVLRGPNESICLNWNGQAVPAGLRLFLNIEWTEENV